MCTPCVPGVTPEWFGLGLWHAILGSCPRQYGPLNRPCCGSGTHSSLNLSHFVARKTWLRRCVSPRRFRANRVQRGEPLRSLLVLVYPNFDLLRTAIAQFITLCSA